MNRHTIATCLLILTSILTISKTSLAEVKLGGALEVVGGGQYDSKTAAFTGSRIGGLADFDNSVTIGNSANQLHVRALINEFELSVSKVFNEKTEIRGDFDFRDIGPSGARAGSIFRLEQGYAYHQWSHMLQLQIGRFNAAVGLEKLDFRDNPLISRAYPLRFLLPQNLTGVQIHFAPGKSHFIRAAIVNDLNDNGFGDSAIPSALFQWQWSKGDKDHRLAISGGVGPEIDIAVNNISTPREKYLDFFFDLYGLFQLSSALQWGTEGTYRQSDVISGGTQKALGGLTLLHYQTNGPWDFTGRFSFEVDLDSIQGATGITSGASTTGGYWNGGFQGGMLSGTTGLGYAITKGAKAKLEYRYDRTVTYSTLPDSASHSLLSCFTYQF